MFAVFIIVSNKWKLHGTFYNKADAKRELEYVVNMLGLKAGLFYKK